MRSARRPARGLASRPMFDASRRAPWVAAACGLLMASTALADPRVVLDRPLRAGAPGWLWVIPEDGDLERAPEVQVRGGDAEVMPARAGAWPVRVVAQAGVPAVTVDVQTATGQRRVEVPVSGLVVGGLELPERVDATAWAPEISFVVRGEALPPPEALEVVLGEGYVTGVAVDGEALVVSARLDDRVFARVVPFAVRDLRTEDPPVWSEVRVRTRHRLPLETEPGAVAEVTIARRSYGPFAADAEGRLSDVMVDVYPGDVVAQVEVRDDLGNQTRGSIPLPGVGRDTLVAAVSGLVTPGRPPPIVYLRGLRGDGAPWVNAAPSCRIAGGTSVAVLDAGAGTWAVPVPAAVARQVDRLRCRSGDVEIDVRLPASEAAAAELRLTAFPAEMSRDFPVSNLRVVAEDARGERLPVRGVELTADLGSVAVEPGSGMVVRAEYQGGAAVSAGGDTVRATVSLAAGSGPVGQIAIAHGAVPRDGGALLAHARALDARGLPLAGVELTLRARAAQADPVGGVVGITGDNGWFTAELELPPGASEVIVEAGDGRRTGAALAVAGASAVPGPGAPDLAVSQVLTIASGPGLILHVEPPVLIAGRGAVALVHVDVREGGESPDVRLEASEGVIGPVRRGKGSNLVAEYAPPPGERSRVVTITAVTEGAGEYSTRLLVEPRPVDRATGIGVGGVTNFGALASPLFTLDTDWRTPLFARQLMARVGFSSFGLQSTIDAGLGNEARVASSVVALSAGLLWRTERRSRAMWLGTAGVFAGYRSKVDYAGEGTYAAVGVLPPGLQLLAGVGWRTTGGELGFEARATGLSAQGGAFGYQGQVGGVGAVATWRVVY